MSRVNEFWRCVLLLVTAAAIGGLCPQTIYSQARSKGAKRSRDLASFRKQLDEKRQKFALALEDLARTCDDKNLPDAAERIRLLAEPVDSAELRLNRLPRQVLGPLPNDLPADERFWQAQLRFQQQAYAKELYALSQKAADAGHVGLAIDLVREIVRHDSDHVKARNILGFVRRGEEWVSTFENEMANAKKVWTDKFGWLPKDRVDRYEKGDRYYNRRWVTATKEAELRREFANAWEIQTEHYLVRTNHSLERGVDLAKKLEDFHGVFFQTMAGFFNSASEVQQLFAGTRPRRPKPNVVNFYRSRDEYLSALRDETKQPIEITRGIYFPRTGIAYFFYDAESDDDSTLYHEATHQLLSGSRPMTGEIGVKSDFWIIEGIACYMESFRREGNGFSVGNPGHQRLQAARIHFVDEYYYVPLRDLARMGMQAFQSVKKPEIAKNYSQGAALTHFFMHYDNGRYREALIEHLSQVYSPTKSVRENPDSLEELTGVEFQELDRQYGDYIRHLVPAPANERTPEVEGAAGR